MSKELEAFSNFVRALAFASRKHSQQRRKDMDASPYINHPIALVSILAVEADINDWDTLCAALLHDSVSMVAASGRGRAPTIRGRGARSEARTLSPCGSLEFL